jgi:arylsulfatase
VGWAHATNTPYQWTKQIASHWGGTRNGTIVHWPNGIQAKGEMRHQFTHVIDVAPTVLEAAGIPEPLFVNGVQQRPIEGVSMLYSFNDANAPERHETQYFEIMGNRGIYHKGWTAVTRHRIPWITTTKDMRAFDEDIWELYDTNTDWSQAKNLAKENPQKLHELQRLWLIEAVKYNVVPLDDRYVERSIPELSGRPELIKGNRQVLFSGMGRLSGFSLINILNKSYSITAEISVPKSGASGVIIANGGVIGGWSLYAKEGRLKYCYNFYGLTETFIESREIIPAGVHQVRLEFTYDGGGLAKGGKIVLYQDGKPVGEGRLEQTEPLGYSADETVDVGNEFGSPVTTDYPACRKFSGEVNWVELAIDKDAIDLDHLISPEERFNLLMAKV